MSQQAKKTTAIRCPDPACNKLVDEAFYPQHIDSGHQLHVVTITGLDPMVTATAKPSTPMVNIPYLGRVRRDGFLAWSFLMLLLGVLMGARII